ncbi:hypothetical protein [Aurantiacibacter suaedae]|uniref:hypothetical protein n=1 Tax=Aurantiacibacter suaedae TaxID=2545755 RepID=UPI0010F4C61A|nr:hypothetical protein [Aurantiacibacter suaedae]
MAKVEQGRTGGTRNKRTGARAPVSAHPAFAAIVALWFAALLGIGSLIVPITVIEKLVVASGLPAIVSAAQPPLGFTARAGIALAATVAGAVIGLIVARQVTRSNRTAIANRSTNPSDLIRRPPVNAHAELGSEGFDGDRSARRRAMTLAVIAEDEEERANDYRAAAYAPSQPVDLDLPEDLELGDASALAEAAPAWHADNTMFAGEAKDPFVNSEEPAPAPFANPAPFARPVEAAASEPQPESNAPRAQDKPQAFSPPAADRPAAAPAPAGVREDLAELGLVQLVQKLEATIEKHRAWLIEKNQRAAEVAAMNTDEVPEPARLDTEEAFGTIAPNEAAQAREAYFDAPSPAKAPSYSDEDESEDDQEQPQGTHAQPEAGDAKPAPIASLAGFTPEHDNEDEDDQAAAALSASFTLPFSAKAANRAPLRQVFETDPAPVADTSPDSTLTPAEPATGNADDGEESYASLTRGFAQRPLRAVRIEEPESDDGEEAAVVFPGQAARAAERSFDPPKAVSSSPAQPQDSQAPASSEETDQALREVLRNLQRMGRAS